MRTGPEADVYSTREIARAAGVSEGDAVRWITAAFGPDTNYLIHRDAVRVARALVRSENPPLRPDRLFTSLRPAAHAASRSTPFVASTTVHVGVVSALLALAIPASRPGAPIINGPAPTETVRLVFVAAAGPGGGGGGGGLRQRLSPPKARRTGSHTVSSPLPDRRPPKALEPVPEPPVPTPPALRSEPLPLLVAPLAAAPADAEDRAGVLHEARVAHTVSRGPGDGGGIGAGIGIGIGIGEGDGAGVGPGSGGGTGGGPFRPGSGIEPPRLLREVKAEYTDEARRRAVQGEVVLEIVVRRDGSVGDIRVLRRLGAGLDERAVQAVRQWRFAPGRRLGAPVDIVVEVDVEFRLR
jgi:protein TonB